MSGTDDSDIPEEEFGNQNITKNFINAFEKAVSATILDEQLIPEVSIDMELELDDINHKFFRIIQQFAPFGPQKCAERRCLSFLLPPGSSVFPLPRLGV